MRIQIVAGNLMKNLFAVMAFLMLAQGCSSIKNPDRGPGKTPCPMYEIYRNSANSESFNGQLFAWTQGFLSGINAETMENGKPPMIVIPIDPDFMYKVDAVCKEKPDSDLMNAVLDVVLREL